MNDCIELATRETPLGWLAIAATRRGVCHVRFGTSEASLAAALRRELPCAAFARAGARTAGWADLLAAAVEGRADATAVPLDVAGSRFQRRVWDALRRIPRGATRGYGEVAASLGQPRAARAVARACAANPVPLAVPCHRVVPRAPGGAGGSTLRASGSTVRAGGYRFGAWRKRRLLAAEAPPSPS